MKKFYEYYKYNKKLHKKPLSIEEVLLLDIYDI